jgi:hypothetical protein
VYIRPQIGQFEAGDIDYSGLNPPATDWTSITAPYGGSITSDVTQVSPAETGGQWTIQNVTSGIANILKGASGFFSGAKQQGYTRDPLTGQLRPTAQRSDMSWILPIGLGVGAIFLLTRK